MLLGATLAWAQTGPAFWQSIAQSGVAAPSIVQTVAGTTGCGGSSTSCVAILAATGSGHSLLVGYHSCGLASSGSPCSSSGSYTLTIADSNNDTCSLVSGTDSGYVNGVRTLYYYCPSVTLGTTQVTVTLSVAVDYPMITVFELSGAIGTEVGGENYTSSSTSITVNTSAATTSQNDLLFTNTLVTSAPTITLGAPWTLISPSTLYWDQIGETPTTYSATPSWNGADGAAASIVAVKP